MPQPKKPVKIKKLKSEALAKSVNNKRGDSVKLHEI